MLLWDFLPTRERRLPLGKAFIEQKPPCHLRSISRRRLAKLARRSGSGGAGWGHFGSSEGFKGCFASPSPANISPPATRGWVGDGRSKLPPVGSPAVPKPPGGRERGAAAWAQRRLQNLLAPGAARRGMEPAPEAKRRHKCTAASPPLSSCLSGQAPQETGPLFLSATWGIYIHIFLLCFVLPDFFPPSCGFAVDRGERLRVRALTAPPEKPGSDFPSEKREAERARNGKEPVGAEPAAPERGGGGARGLRYPPTESDPRLSSTPGWPLRSHEALLF